MSRVSAWSHILNRFRDKLSGWKLKHMSTDGCLTILKPVLGSFSSYFMLIFPVLYSVLRSLDSLKARFLWGDDIGERRMHWVRWEGLLACMNVGWLGWGV